jgi:hypothetical protein
VVFFSEKGFEIRQGNLKEGGRGQRELWGIKMYIWESPSPLTAAEHLVDMNSHDDGLKEDPTSRPSGRPRSTNNNRHDDSHAS